MPIPDYAELALREQAASIARAMAGSGSGHDLQVALLKSGSHATVVKVEHDGHRAIAKVFAPGQAHRAPYLRERDALGWLPADMVPGLLSVAEARRLLLMSFISGERLDLALNDGNLIRHAEHLGQWFARLANIAPTRPAKGSWHDYLMQYRKGFDRAVLNEHARLLGASATGLVTLAHNDNALDNFILGRDRRLYGIDFSQSRMKPLGWDLVTAAQALFRRFPGELSSIAASLVRGYALSARHHLPAPNFAELITLLVLAGPKPEAAGRRRFREMP